MKDKNIAIVYYTPISDTQSIKRINVTKEEDYSLVKGFIIKNTKRKRNPEINSFDSSGLSEIAVIKRIKSEFPNIKDDSVRDLFDILSNWVYTSGRKDRYFALIIDGEFLFIYNFKPEESITYKENEIEAFIKYLDTSTINRFIFLTDNKKLEEYYDRGENENQFVGSEEILYTYEKQKTKGFQELTKGNPVYDEKGNIKVRGEYDSETDLVIETEIPHLTSLKDSISMNIEEKKISINGLEIPISEIQINGKKYNANDAGIIRNHLYYNSLSIDEFISEMDFYSTKNKNLLIYEEKSKITLVKDNNKVKSINKPIKRLLDKPTIFILGQNQGVYNSDAIIKALSEDLIKHTSLSLVEISKFNDKYNMLNLSDLTVFFKFRDYENASKFTELINHLLNNIKGENNSFYTKILSLIFLMNSKKFIKNRRISDIVYKSAQNSLSHIFSQLAKQKHSMDLNEIDKIGIEYKAGVRNDGRGFFDPSAKKFSQKILGKLKGKRYNLIFLLVGINEDLKDFSPIPLSQIRNEFREEVKTNLETQGYKVLVLESIPLDSNRGILLAALMRSWNETTNKI